MQVKSLYMFSIKLQQLSWYASAFLWKLLGPIIYGQTEVNN